MKEHRLSWGPHQAAQAEADAAWNAVLCKAREREAQKFAARRKRTNNGIFAGTYHDYLKSPQWRKKRRKALRHYKGRCTICGSTERLEVHHRHYRTLFREAMADLDVHCYGCHRNHHEADKGAIDPMTAEYLALEL